jgi:hypothetical protein
VRGSACMLGVSIAGLVADARHRNDAVVGSYFLPFAAPLAGAAAFFAAGVTSAAVLMSSISLVTREALLPRSLSK